MIRKFKTPISDNIVNIGPDAGYDQIILATETSCDETAAAVVLNGRHVLSNVVASQIETHKKYGGVVPEVAAREHLESINMVVEEAVKKSGIKLNEITAFAATVGPGLVGALLVGLNTAKSLSLVYDKPFLGVNHLNAHVCANYLSSENENPNIWKPPFVCLLISGGHTQIIRVNSYCNQELIGETLDDAVGEAYDKVARLLKLPYPGGPLLDKMAQTGDKNRFKFTEAKVGEYDFSFSGLKTAVLRLVQSFDGTSYEKPPVPVDHSSSLPLRSGCEIPREDIAASFQEAVSVTLLKKTLKAAKDSNINQITLAGGVAANSEIRKKFFSLENTGFRVHAPALKYCTDNAAMVASSAYFLSNVMEELDIEVFSRVK
ncbi:MAG: tRNA (adenosine(37)-N6)-threonylcarbamoyltransferase complex transferase subunit TsaD [Candidatus Gastranaerophilales bacterium]|nr:tRNA (adenosine(37)-N6)-threonylcarbamoyltransferase complex transferase subunit TsaD [Candidatus Gastranaerophilales bacterium]